MQFIEETGVVLSSCSELCLQLLVAEGGGLDVLIDDLLHLHDPLHDLLHLHGALDVDGLHPHLPLHPPRRLKLTRECLRLQF
jgi:hypothetical protein